MCKLAHNSHILYGQQALYSQQTVIKIFLLSYHQQQQLSRGSVIVWLRKQGNVSTLFQHAFPRKYAVALWVKHGEATVIGAHRMGQVSMPCERGCARYSEFNSSKQDAELQFKFE